MNNFQNVESETSTNYSGHTYLIIAVTGLDKNNGVSEIKLTQEVGQIRLSGIEFSDRDFGVSNSGYIHIDNINGTITANILTGTIGNVDGLLLTNLQIENLVGELYGDGQNITSLNIDNIIGLEPESTYQVADGSQIKNVLGANNVDVWMQDSNGDDRVKYHSDGASEFMAKTSGTETFSFKNSSDVTMLVIDDSLYRNSSYSHGGHLIGYDEDGYDSRPIYTIGDAYRPDVRPSGSLNMIGIGLSGDGFYSNYTTLTRPTGWGLYVASENIGTVLQVEDGTLWVQADYYAQNYYDTSDNSLKYNAKNTYKMDPSNYSVMNKVALLHDTNSNKAKNWNDVKNSNESRLRINLIVLKMMQ